MSHTSVAAFGEHHYPPTYSSSSGSLHPSHALDSMATASNHHVPASSSRLTLTHYRVHSKSQGISDLRLQVSSNPDASSSAAANATPPSTSGDDGLEPIWYRHRFLSDDNEIVDQLVESGSSKVSWTIHRPTRGWYLHLKSPLLPRGMAIVLRPSGQGCDSSVTPLSFTVRTRVRASALAQARGSIESAAASHSASSSPERPGSASASSRRAGEARRSVHDSRHRPSQSRSTPGKAKSDDHDEAAASASSTARGHATGRSESLHQGHARRRSAAGSGSGLQPFGPRKASTRNDLTVGSHTIVEGDEEVAPSVSSDAEKGRPANTKAIPNVPRSPHADRPYSPAEPRPFGIGPWGPTGVPGNGRARIWDGEPTDCTFVLCDGARQPFLVAQNHSRPEPDNPHHRGDASPLQLEAKQGWARWAWSLFPRDLRPALPLDTDKSFSLWWIDPPSLSASDAPVRRDELDPGSAAPIEVLRFGDRSGWWMWDAGTRGDLTLQDRAVEAVGLQREFWVATALAYLDFLETKDGYEAAKDG